jgi:membrane protease YdiL (CAAX protease family)
MNLAPFSAASIFEHLFLQAMSFPDPSTVQVDLIGWWFLTVIGVMVPIAAIRSASRTRDVDIQSSHRISQRLRNVVVLSVLAIAALYVAHRDHIDLFEPVRIMTRLVVVSLGILAGTLILAELLLIARSPEERKKLWVRQIIPRNNAERLVWVISSCAAGATEEIIFRGVFFALLVAVTESITIASLLSAIVFAIAHYRQGFKSMAFILGIALLFQWLVIYSGSLIPAMIVHALYNIVRGLRASAKLRET